ncbi:MAG TPA: SiaB family protein kinase, partial [Salinivirgaceae bacterium]|nr:SiaB family protein kinase [Salinivirgaceae bacterium]
KIDDVCSYFYFHTCITPREDDDNVDTELVRIDNIFLLHQILQQKEVQLIYNGVFNQENLINLLNIIESQMEGMGHIKRVVFNMMVEMLQNIVKHALRNEERKGNPGIFFINKKNGMHVLNTGNYILKEKINKVKDKIDYINSLNREELDDYYSKCLFDFQIDSPKESGLGFIELRMKSADKLRYRFQEIDDKTSFFILQVYIE